MLYSFRNKEPVFGKDTYISEEATVIGNVKMGDNCYIGPGAIIRGDYGNIIIESGTAVEDGVIIHAFPFSTCTIGQKVTIGHGAIIHCKSIGDYASIGMGAILSINSEIGENTIIAEATLIKAKQIVPANVLVGGNPARELRKITDQDREHWAMGKQIYIDLAKEYLHGDYKKIQTN
ncbi:MAG: gamma carbonic anhydrase family protein [Dehalococcoidia bacterium]|nr:gamma carbonic anhydrase family protein [Dehalococcoidia bacterium]